MTATASQLAALRWLRNRNGDGVFDRNQVLIVCGERAPVMRSTWSRLELLGFVERYHDKRRLRVTKAGLLVDCSRVEESLP